MKKYAPWLLLLLPIYAAIVVQCTPSLHPIFRNEDLNFDPALIGVWQTEDSKETWTIGTLDDSERSYGSTYTDEDGKTGEFLTYLVAIGDHKFLDFYPMPKEPAEGDYSFALMQGMHGFVAVDQIEPDLIVRVMDDEWLAAYLRDNPDALKHEWVAHEWSSGGSSGEDALVLTASIEELQAFMIEHLDTEGAYGEPEVYHRIGEPPAPTETQNNTGEQRHGNPYRK
jgi:hypothetical protein